MYTLPFVKKYLAFLIIAGFLIANTGLFAETVNYTYDDMNRLIKVKYGDGTVVERNASGVLLLDVAVFSFSQM